MKYGGQLLFVLLGGLSVCAAASAVTSNASNPSASPYDGIIDRNVFGLKPPPPPPDPEATKTPPAKITLTGITTILGNKRALMKTPPPQGKPGEPPKTEQSYILTIGQREGDIEVIDIDEKAGSVKVNNAGTVLTLTFEKDGAKLPATPPPPAPGVPVPGAIPALPNPAIPAGTQPGGSGFTLPTRAIRTVPTPGVVNPTGGSYGAGLTPGTSVPSLPTYTTAQSQAQIAQQASAQQSAASPEQQVLMMELQREANKNNPKFPPLPPTALTPQGDNSTAPAQGPQRAPSLPPRLPGMPQLPQ
jgi:hypothetical protein